MEIGFCTAQLRDTCCDPELRLARFGPDGSKRLQLRLEQLTAAVTLDHVRALPQAGCRRIQGTGNAQFTLDVDASHQLLVEAANGPLPQNADGSDDLTTTRRVRVLAILDPNDKMRSHRE